MGEKHHIDLPILAIILLFGVFPSFVLLFSSAFGDKWFYSSVTILSTGLVALTVKDVKNVLMCLFVLTITLPIDFNIIYNPSIYQRTVNGLNIHIADIFLVPLLLWWWGDILTSRNSRKIYFPPKLNWIFMGILVLSFMSILKSYDRTAAFFAWLLMVKCYFFFLFFVNNITTQDQLKKILFFLLLGVSIHAVAAIAQKATGGLGLAEFLGEADIMTMKAGTDSVVRIAGITGHPNQLAMLLNWFIPLLLVLPFCNISIPFKAVSLFLGFPLFFIAEYFTLSRSGLVSLVIGLVPVLYLLAKKRHIPRFIAFITVITTLLFISFGIFLFSDSLQQRFINEDYGAAGTRVDLVEVAINVIMDNPILGVGINSYTGAMGDYDTTSVGITKVFPAPVHNSFFLVGAETGLINLGFFIAFLFIIFQKLRVLVNQSNRFTAYISIGFIGGLITWVIHNQYDYTNIYNYQNMWLLFSLIVVMETLEHDSSFLKML